MSDALRGIEGLNSLLGNVNASLTTAATTLTIGTAFGGTNAVNALIDGIFLPNAVSATAKYPQYVLNDGITLLGTPGYATQTVLANNVGITQGSQQNVGAYGQAAIIAFGVQLYRNLSPGASQVNSAQPAQPLTIQQSFQPGTSQVDNSGGNIGAFGLTNVVCNSTGGAITFTSPGAAASGAPQLAAGQLIQVSGTQTAGGTVPAGTYIVAPTGVSQTGVTLYNLLTGSAVTTTASATPIAGLTFTVIPTTASLQTVVSAIVGPVANIDKSGTVLNPGADFFPSIPDNFILIGYAEVVNPFNSGTAVFTPGTTNWNATGIQSTFFNAAQISKRARTQFA